MMHTKWHTFVERTISTQPHLRPSKRSHSAHRKPDENPHARASRGVCAKAEPVKSTSMAVNTVSFAEPPQPRALRYFDGWVSGGNQLAPGSEAAAGTSRGRAMRSAKRRTACDP